MPFDQRTDWQDLPAGGTPVLAADLLRIEQGVKDAVDHSDAAHAPANADNTAANETSHTLEAAHRTGNGSDHADVAANTAAHSALQSAGAVRAGITAITTGATCVIDWSTGASVYKFTATVGFTISLSNLPAGAWGIVLMLTNGGAFTWGYSTDWKEEKGEAIILTAAGTDRLVITGEGSDATTIIITRVTEDPK